MHLTILCTPSYADRTFWRIDLEPAVDDLSYFRENDRKFVSDIVALGSRKGLLEGHSYSVWEGHGISNHLYLGRGFDPLHALLRLIAGTTSLEVRQGCHTTV